MTEPAYVQIIHPDLGPDQIADVPASSLGEWFVSGWRRLAPDEAPLTPIADEPPPMTRAEAARTAGGAKTGKAAAADKEK
jgi:hypothetical protein